MDQRHEELLNREIDGEATPQESAELRRLIARDPQLRARYEELTALVRALDRVGSSDPPAGLLGDVLRRIAARPAPAAQRSGWPEALRAALARPPAFRYAFAFAGGLALGILASALAVRRAPLPGTDVTALTGTILPDTRLEGLEPASRERLELAGVQGEAITRADGGRVLAEVHLDSSAAIVLALEFDPAALAPLAFEQSGTGHDVILGPQELRLSHVGRGQYSLLFEVKAAAAATLRLRLESGRELLERTLRASREGS